MDRKISEILILFALSVIAIGCVKDKPAGTVAISSTGNVYIVCEGNMGNGDGSLYNYNITTDRTSGDLFRSANNVPMGDVFQSMTRIGDSLFLCVNNSDKIVVLNVTTKKIAGTISIPKPRYIVAVNRSLAYVSTLYSNKIYTIDPTTLQVKGAIDMPYNNSEGMSLQGGTLWVCHWDTSCRSINGIDALTGQKTRTISIGKYAPHTILADKEGLLWVMSGNVTKGRSAALSRIDPSTGLVVRQLNFAGLSDPVKPVFNRTKDTLWFIQVKYDGSEADNGIYRMSINDTSLPTAPLIKASKYQYYWALGIDPVNGNVYVGDPKGFVQKGQVNIYNTAGDLQKTFSVGVGPGQFYFDK
jgi:hypothetical protein